MKKYYFVLVLAILFMFMGTGNLLAADDIKVYVNGNQVVFPDQKPMINADSRTLVPVRFVSEALGADVEWQGDTDTVNIAHKGKSINLVIGQKQARVDEDNIVLDTAAALVNSRTMVPLRFVSEGLGAEVQWDQYARAIYITTFEKEVTAFVGKDLVSAGLKDDLGNVMGKSRIPGAPDALYMFVTPDQLPVKFGDDIIFSIEPGPETIAVKQSSSARSAAQMLIIQDGIMVGSRTGSHGVVVNPFIAQYDTKNALDESLGTPRIEIEKVNAFAFIGMNDDYAELYLVVKNPLYKGDWSL